MFGAFASKGKGKSGAHVAPVDFDGEGGVACLCEALRSSSTHECVQALRWPSKRTAKLKP
jgi:hypothetical protein